MSQRLLQANTAHAPIMLPMKITLLDPGLKSTRGHHFDLDLRLAQALLRRGHDVEIHGHIAPDAILAERAQTAGITLRHTFRISTYTRIRSYQPKRWAYARLIARTAADLRQVPVSDLWFWPTLAPYQLAAALTQRHAVHQLGGTWWHPAKPVPAGEQAWAKATSQLLQHHYPITVGAYDLALCQAHKGVSPGLDMTVLPCPHDGTSKTRHTSAVRRIGFFGHQRNERGAQLLPALVEALLARGFEVVLQDSGQADYSLADHPNLTTLPYIDDFATEIVKCDLVVWSSQAVAYQGSWSGVVSECIASGVPLVAASGCIPGDLVARYRCGTLFHTLALRNILEAVDQAITEYPALTQHSKAAAIHWQQHNGTDRLAACIEAYAREGTTS